MASHFLRIILCYEIQIMENIHINSWHICATSNSPGCQANNMPLSCFWLANLRTKSKQTDDGWSQIIDCKYTYQWCSSSSITFIFSFFSSSTNVSRMKLETRPFKWRWSINQSFVTFSSIRKYWNINFLLDKGQSFRSWFSTITWEQKKCKQTADRWKIELVILVKTLYLLPNTEFQSHLRRHDQTYFHLKDMVEMFGMINCQWAFSIVLYLVLHWG